MYFKLIINISRFLEFALPLILSILATVDEFSINSHFNYTIMILGYLTTLMTMINLYIDKKVIIEKDIDKYLIDNNYKWRDLELRHYKKTQENKNKKNKKLIDDLELEQLIPLQFKIKI